MAIAASVPSAAIVSIGAFSSSFSSKFYSAASRSRLLVDATKMDPVTKCAPYPVPEWAQSLSNPPINGRLNLGNFPTPLQKLDTSLFRGAMEVFHDLNISFYVKRDDMSGGAELGGNKIRKLEFLLADAKAKGCDCIVTIGGEQSNHCRATACAARMVGLEPHLILRTKKATYDDDGDAQLGLTGNVLFDRLAGSSIYTCTPGEYGRFGQDALVEKVCSSLRGQNRIPYAIPVGGSNALGTWGYINGVDELMVQLEPIGGIDHVVFACGSGGTFTGITLGLSQYKSRNSGAVGRVPQIHAVGVCDSPEYFYSMFGTISKGMGLQTPPSLQPEDMAREWAHVYQGKGLGYAISTPEELAFIKQFSLDTGIVLDPVYTGKGLYNFVQVVKAKPEEYRGSKVLFWHTGGALGMFDRDLFGALRDSSTVERLDVYGKLGQTEG